MLNEVALIISVLVGVSTLIGAWLKMKQSEMQRSESELRVKDVFAWSNEVISRLAALRMCVLKTLYQDQGPQSPALRKELEEIALDTSSVPEIGRAHV